MHGLNFGIHSELLLDLSMNNFKMTLLSFSRIVGGENNVFEFNLKYLFFVGLWPHGNWASNHRRLYKIYEITLHILGVTYLILTSIGTYQIKDDTILLLSNLDKTLVAYNFIFKISVFIYKRDDLKILIDKMVNSGDIVSDSQLAMMAKLVVLVTSVTTGIVTAFTAVAFFRGEMSVEAWMPFDPMKSRMHLFSAVQISAMTFLVPCSYRAYAMQGLVCSMLMYMRIQLIDLQDRIKALVYVKEREPTMRMEFKKIVKKHIRLMGYATAMEQIFREYFLIQNVAVTVELCLNAIMVTLVGLEQKLLAATFIAFLSLALLNAFIYCYLGNELMVQSEGIAVAAYDSSWTSWPIDMQKDLLTVITVAQQPMRLTAGGMSLVSIETYSQTLCNGYSIFAVINDVVN